MRFIFAALAALAISACSTPPVNRAVTAPPLPTTAFVDVDQYLGKWYEIARFPNSFEEGCVAVTAEYARREDGLISVINRCRQETFDGEEKVARGRARIVDAQSNAKLKVSFFGPFWGDYWIVDLAPDYSHAIVSEPEGRYLWVLARTPTLSDEVKAQILTTLEALEFNTEALYFTPQPAEGT